MELALTLFFKRQKPRKLSWLDKDSDKDQSQFDELFNWTPVISFVLWFFLCKYILDTNRATNYQIYNTLECYFKLIFKNIFIFYNKHNLQRMI
jgi:hypothetical protein